MKDNVISVQESCVLRHHGLIAALLCSVAPLPVLAQQNDDAVAERAAEAPAAIIVTGSRVARDGYDAPTPLTVLGKDLLETKATTQVADALATMPAFRNVSTSSTAGVSNSGTAGQSFANLRGMGANRTLVLLDGQRFVPSTASGTVDIGLIPSALIDRVDVVTGGASAAYGSDAVTGVVNFVLNNRLDHLKANAEVGLTQYGDNFTYKTSLAWGTKIGDSAHLIVSGQYLKGKGVSAGTRDYLMYTTEMVDNTTWAAGSGTYKRYILPYVYLNNVTYGGVIVGGPLGGTTFEENGTYGRFAGGKFGAGSTNYVADGLVPGQPYVTENAQLVTPVENLSLYSRFAYDVADGTELFVSGIYAENKPGPYTSTPAQTRITGNHVIRRDNAFLPTAIADLMDQNGLTSIQVGRYSADWGDTKIKRNNTTWRVAGGINSKFAPGWEMNAYVQYGENKNIFNIENNYFVAEQKLAVDAVRSGNDIICRDALTNPNSTCVPLNIFGVGSADPKAVAYIRGTSSAHLKYTQEVYAMSVAGEPFDMWAGPVSLAFGLEHRKESLKQTVDARSQAGAFFIGNPKALSGKFAVTEGFVETVIPLMQDQPFFQSLDFNGAFRYTDYDTSGTVQTWKLGLNWVPVDGVRFRGTRSRDIRAPNISELWTSPIQQGRTVRNPWLGTSEHIQTFTNGNADLKAEKADTIALGVVFQPDFLPGFNMSVDYYSIKIKGGITTISFQDLIDRCYGGSSDLCQYISFENNGAFKTINNPFLNLASIKTDGIDFEASYRTNFVGGDLSFRLLANRIFSLTYDDGITTINRAGDLSEGQPRLNANFITSYSRGKVKADIDMNYIGSGNYNNTYTGLYDINDNSISNRLYLNSQITYKLGSGDRARDIYFNISNITNVTPPGIFTYRNGPNYDRAGRSFKVGIRAEF